MQLFSTADRALWRLALPMISPTLLFRCLALSIRLLLVIWIVLFIWAVLPLVRQQPASCLCCCCFCE